MNTENDLRRALRREEPPCGFAERVIAMAAVRKPVTERRPWWKMRGLMLANSFALTAALLMAGVVYQRRQERRAMAARQQLVTALNMTRASLQKTQERIRRVAAKPVI